MRYVDTHTKTQKNIAYFLLAYQLLLFQYGLEQVRVGVGVDQPMTDEVLQRFPEARS